MLWSCLNPVLWVIHQWNILFANSSVVLKRRKNLWIISLIFHENVIRCMWCSWSLPIGSKCISKISCFVSFVNVGIIIYFWQASNLNFRWLSRQIIGCYFIRFWLLNNLNSVENDWLILVLFIMIHTYFIRGCNRSLSWIVSFVNCAWIHISKNSWLVIILSFRWLIEVAVWINCSIFNASNLFIFNRYVGMDWLLFKVCNERILMIISSVHLRIIINWVFIRLASSQFETPHLWLTNINKFHFNFGFFLVFHF